MLPAVRPNNNNDLHVSVGSKAVPDLHHTKGYTDVTWIQLLLLRAAAVVNGIFTPGSQAPPADTLEGIMNTTLKPSLKKAERNILCAESQIQYYPVAPEEDRVVVLESINGGGTKGHEYGFIAVAEYEDRHKNARPFSL